jgi:hypothetical protein
MPKRQMWIFVHHRGQMLLKEELSLSLSLSAFHIRLWRAILSTVEDAGVRHAMRAFESFSRFDMNRLSYFCHPAL